MKRIERILVPVDYELPSREAVAMALVLAKALGAAVEVLHVWDDHGYLDSDMRDAGEVLIQRARERMREFLATFELPENLSLRSSVLPGTPCEALVRLSNEYDLIVMGTHGRKGLDRLLFGSVALELVRRAACPVLTVR